MAQAQSKSVDGEWQAWIERQRELLNKPGSAGKAGAAAPFKIGEELLGIWRNAWTTAGAAQHGATQGISDLLGKLPPIGLAREQVAAWQELATIQEECQRLEQELRNVMTGVQREALDLLDARVRQRREKNQPVASYRDLYDLWVECAEQVFAKVAHSDAYGKLQAELGNATVRLKARQQKVIEYALKQFDLPTRSEINSVHLQLRQLKQKVAALEHDASAKPVARAVRKPTAKQAKRKSR